MLIKKDFNIDPDEVLRKVVGVNDLSDKSAARVCGGATVGTKFSKWNSLMPWGNLEDLMKNMKSGGWCKYHILFKQAISPEGDGLAEAKSVVFTLGKGETTVSQSVTASASSDFSYSSSSSQSSWKAKAK
jgi:hypothetical protein